MTAVSVGSAGIVKPRVSLANLASAQHANAPAVRLARGSEGRMRGAFADRRCQHRERS
jgi:hypothetical protein